MSWREELTLKLPPPGEDEPAALRQEIQAELEDHLECAMQRELRKTDDHETARQRVISRFGDPARLARRLWLDAMKGQLMNQRLMFGTNIVMASVVITLCIVVIVMLRGQQSFQSQLLANLQNIGATSGDPESTLTAELLASYDWPQVELKVTDSGGENPKGGLELSLRGELYAAGNRTSIRRTIGEDGTVVLGPMRPGRYDLYLVDPAAEIRHNRQILVPPGPTQRKTIQWVPGPGIDQVNRSVDLVIAESSDLPELPADAGFVIHLSTSAIGAPQEESWIGPDMLIAVRGDGQSAVLDKTFRNFSMQSHSMAQHAIEAALNEVEWRDEIPFETMRSYNVDSGTIRGHFSLQPVEGQTSRYVLTRGGSSEPFRPHGVRIELIDGESFRPNEHEILRLMISRGSGLFRDVGGTGGRGGGGGGSGQPGTGGARQPGAPGRAGGSGGRQRDAPERTGGSGGRGGSAGGAAGGN